MRTENIESIIKNLDFELQKIKLEIKGKNRRIRILEEKVRSIRTDKLLSKSFEKVLFPEMDLTYVIEKSRLTSSDMSLRSFLANKISKKAYLCCRNETGSN